MASCDTNLFRRILARAACISVNDENISNPMNKLFLTLLLGPAISAQMVYSQDQTSAPTRNPRPATFNLPVRAAQGETDETATLQKFDLDFPGGSPRDLVSAIEKATGKPLNALVPKEDEALELPSIKLKAVTVPALFEALRMASQKNEIRNNMQFTSSYSFQTQGHGEDAIWYFQYQRPPQPQEFCKFYQVAPDLENYTIQDITTAIQTGWKLLGIKSPPQLKFHPETKLLIGVGEMEQLAMIDSVLQELRKAPLKPRKPRDTINGHTFEPQSGSGDAQKKNGAPDKQ